jgi:hypothetical protein
MLLPGSPTILDFFRSAHPFNLGIVVDHWLIKRDV